MNTQYTSLKAVTKEASSDSKIDMIMSLVSLGIIIMTPVPTPLKIVIIAKYIYKLSKAISIKR